MKIAIIGSGNVGSALAKSWAKAGHRIFVGSRNPENANVKSLADSDSNISVHSTGEAIAQAEVILIATPAQTVIALAGQLQNSADKVIIDATNALFSKPGSYQNSSEALRDLTDCPHVVKCFNATGFENMYNPVYDGEGVDMFVAGDSMRGKETAKQLARDIGFAVCHDFGGDDKIPLLEQLAMAWINLAIMQKQGRNIAFKVVKR